ncbi:MAG TPA: nuclear transport factor 2 family protein [Actinomycetes bacterium]|nr:nuclear transport factor 2 family protein [Actinomycetes bacterium]
MAEGELAEIVRSYYRLVDTSDFTRMLELFADDAVYRRPGYAPLVGKPALTEFYLGVRVIESGRHELSSILVQDRSAAVEGQFAGQLKDGTSVRLQFADFFRFHAGRIVERSTYFDAPAV